ncbi:MAG: LemA family protein [Proteobacteria bacterium]|nr:LemA family protein [Pseudomonadota bacterium]
MSLIVVVAAVLGLLALGWVVLTYNHLVRDRNRVAQSWSDVDVQLTRRHDLVPRLLEVVKGYASYERALLENITQLRSLGSQLRSPAQLTPVETDLAQGLQRVIAVAEAYPDLKANESFLGLQRELAETENQIQFARRYYNGAVNLYNTRIESVPDMLVAKTLGFRVAEFFDLDSDEQATTPAVRL